MAAVAVFIWMIYAIVNINPLASLSIFVSLGLAGTSFFMFHTASVKNVGPLFPREEPPSHAGVAGYDPDVPRGRGSGFCPYCGSPLDDGATFCRVCGRKV